MLIAVHTRPRKKNLGGPRPHALNKFFIDMKDIMGYINLMIRVLIGQCARAWNLQLSPPLKSRGVGGNPGLQAKPFFIWVGPAHMLLSGRVGPAHMHQTLYLVSITF